MQQWAAVQELRKRKVPIQQISKQLEMSRNTVKKLLKLREEPRYTRMHYPSKVDSYMKQIIQWRKQPECIHVNKREQLSRITEQLLWI